MKNKACFFAGLLCALLTVPGMKAHSQSHGTNGDYNPRYWVEGTTSYNRTPSKTSIEKMINDVDAKGWGGVLYWGASRNGAKINYYYKSPFLEKQPWAVFERDALSPIIEAARKKNIK
ncbi:MAG TPA: hypothetical protein VJ279_02875, partial [Hanamia sp.]|nr:hypothetical protein [Hanamia sp.]